MYVINNLHKSLPGKPVIRVLNCLRRVGSVKQVQLIRIIEQYPSLLVVLVSFVGEYIIKL